MAQQLSFTDVDFNQLTNTHDIITLSPWGPYSKHYAGISHIPDMQKGVRFDVSVMPGYYRNKVLVPNVLFESGYYPWKVSADMRRITYRYELEWKDQVYVDVTYSVLDSSTVLISMNCVNHTSLPQNLTLDAMSYLDYPSDYPKFEIKHSENVTWVNGIAYENLTFANPRPSDDLVYNGWFRAEQRNDSYIGSSAIAKNFGDDQQDIVTYTLPISKQQLKGELCFRYRLGENTKVSFKCSGLINQMVTFQGTGEFELLSLPYEVTREGNQTLRLESQGGAGIELNGFFYGPKKDVEESQIVNVEKRFRPEIALDTANSNLMLHYPDISTQYGIAWDFSPFKVREFLNDELDIFFRENVHHHTQNIFRGNGLGHFTDVYLRPIEMQPNSERTIYGMICSGNKASVEKRLNDFKTKRKLLQDKDTFADNPFSGILPEGEKYVFSQKMMRAAVLSNIVYPIYTQGNYIRHFTPGKWWNSLYTWDSGFEAIGLTEIDPKKALECLNAYTTPAGSQSAFIHHGSPVPVQMYAFYDLWNETQSRDLLNYFYPRLKQYYEFMSGSLGSSTTRVLKSNLLKTWDYFYNSGGWDDYPAQVAVHDLKLEDKVAPVITTAQIIRVAKILRMVAQELDMKKDIKKYDEDIALFTNALQKYSWDEQAGYFSYVTHDDQGNPTGFFKDSKSGKIYNMGLDGAYPLFSGICSKHQEDVLLDRIFSKDHMWTPAGIGVVDQSAPYYKIDGYWNGTVWMPHQWFMWKTMLDLGKPDLAFKIASKALDVWKTETDESYYTFEHFFAKSGRGAGWHQFSGLSTPVLAWFDAYYKPGTVTTGFEVWIEQQSFSNEKDSYEASLSFDQATAKHKRSMIVCMNPARKYSVLFNGDKAEVTSPLPGVLEISLPVTNKSGKLVVDLVD